MLSDSQSYEQTDGHDHQQGHDPLGPFLQRAEAKHCGALRQRKPRSCPGVSPLYRRAPLSEHNCAHSSSSFVARMQQLLVVDLGCLTTRAPRHEGFRAAYTVDEVVGRCSQQPGRACFPSCGVGQTVLSWRHVVLSKPARKRVASRGSI